MPKAVVLLSGGMDSAVTLYTAARENECYALSFDYGQKAERELDFASRIAKSAGARHIVVKIAMPWKGSALLDSKMRIPEHRLSKGNKIPSTYVPARNIIFLSFAVSCAEAVGADKVYIGAHQLDFSNYPDCRDTFFRSFQDAVNKGTKTGAEKHGVRIVTPIINMTKREIILAGIRLGVPFENTWSCYGQGKTPCGKCESCMLRAKGFRDAGLDDPLINKKRAKKRRQG
ncbi:MAG TPA: 7-cyano-7-deazaguanine synthase QueC [Candidatus Omnitrophota bacterium]|nr:7-cyano-7-deazaguanine synthase QueC [Candidatus Omnitrophota bacterium]HPS19848.1 7-cyano-7-deazaguanine synthase QueC [Candidatus Omnitrophota bacterium]